MHRKALIATAGVTLGITAAGLSMSACGSAAAPAAHQPTVTVTPTSPPNTPPPNTPATPPPANAAPAPSQPEITNPWAVVSAYYGDIESGNYSQAWSLLSPAMQTTLGPYSAWVAGYQTTTQTSVSEVSQSGDTVTVSITAQQTDGSTKSYTGDYTVDNGQITSAQVTQN